MKVFIFFSVLSSSCLFASVSSSMSPARDPRIPFEQYMEEAHTENFLPTALSASRTYDESQLGDVAEWESVEVTTENFKTMRDDRYLGRYENRRIPWLYPDDGCYARAALMNAWFVNHKITSPSKVFAFGKLSAQSAILNHTSYWWYHVAPIVQINGQKYVLDPSVDPTVPMTLHDWLDAIGEPDEIKISLCKAGTYVPSDICSDDTIGVPATATTNELLGNEWWLVKKEGKDPNKLLMGEETPWETSPED